MTVTGVPSQMITSTEKIQDCSTGWQSSAANLSAVYSEFMHTGTAINFEWYCETLGKLEFTLIRSCLSFSIKMLNHIKHCENNCNDSMPWFQHLGSPNI